MVKETEKLQIALIDAVMGGNFRRVSELLRVGVDPNAVLDAANVTPLHFAAQNTDINIIKELLKHGANPVAKTVPDGETPLDIACLFNNFEVIRLLQQED